MRNIPTMAPPAGADQCSSHARRSPASLCHLPASQLTLSILYAAGSAPLTDKQIAHATSKDADASLIRLLPLCHSQFRIPQLRSLSVPCSSLSVRYTPLKKLPPERLVVARPSAISARVFFQDLGDAVELRVEIVEQVQRDRLQRHGQLGAAKLVLSVVADDDVLEPQQQLDGEFFARQPLRFGDFVFQCAQHHNLVPNEL